MFILAGGVWADRLRRQFVMLASDALRAAVQAGLAVLLVTGQAHVWQLGLGGAIYGAAQSFFGPASAGLVPETVPAGQLQQANALMSFSGSFFSVGGPAAAGVLVAVIPGIRAVRRTAEGNVVGPPLKDRSSVTATRDT